MHRAPTTAAALGVALLLLSPATPAAAAPESGRTIHVSVTHDGSAPDLAESFSGRGGEGVDISADGRFVAFASRAANLVPSADTNGTYDIFVRDLATGTTERVTTAGDGAAANGASHNPAISADGRFVAYDSDATNIVTADDDTVVDVYVHDRQTGETEVASVSTAGQKTDQDAVNPAISADGRHVSFSTSATNWGTEDRLLCQDVYLRDREAGTTTLVTVAADGTPGDGACTYVVASAVSGDGGLVAFETQMHDLVEPDLNASWDIFVRDASAGATERVSVSSNGEESNYVSYNPAISSDGRYVVFSSCASNLVPEDNNSSGTRALGVTGGNTCFDVFVHDRQTGRTERVSVSSDGDEGDQGAQWADISADGRFVAFASSATTLGESGFLGRLYVHDRHTGRTEFVSTGPGGEELSQVSWADPPAISADGRFVAFSAGTEIYLRDRGPHTGAFGLAVSGQGDWAEVSGLTRFGGAVIATAADDTGDGEAEALGGDLAGASVAYRPETADLLVRFDVTDLTSASTRAVATNYVVPGVAGAPGILHSLTFELGGIRYEVRAVRDNAEEPGYPPPALLDLWKCDPTCAEIEHLDGSYGGTGESIIAAVPLADLGASEGDALTGLAASVAVGHALGGEQQRLDEVSLGEATIPKRRLEIGVAPEGTPVADVPFETLEHANASFSSYLDLRGLPDGPYDVWARACLGDACGAASIPLP